MSMSSSDSESTDSDQKVPLSFRQKYRRWLRKRVLLAAGTSAAGEGQPPRQRRRSCNVAEPEVARGLLVRRPATLPSTGHNVGPVGPDPLLRNLTPATLLAPAIPRAIVPTQPGRLYAPWPAPGLQRAEPLEWLRLALTPARPPPFVRPAYFPPLEVTGQSFPATVHESVRVRARQECNAPVDLELRLGL